MSQESFAQMVAACVCDQEMKFCRCIGMSEFDAAVQSFHVLDETYLRAFSPLQPAVFEPARIVTGRR